MTFRRRPLRQNAAVAEIIIGCVDLRHSAHERNHWVVIVVLETTIDCWKTKSGWIHVGSGTRIGQRGVVQPRSVGDAVAK